MMEFFRGWRRKVGVCTLVVACLATAGWVRSLSVRDEFTISNGKDFVHRLMSFDEMLFWSHDRQYWHPSSWNAIHSSNLLSNNGVRLWGDVTQPKYFGTWGDLI